MTPITLLGPQRFRMSVRAAVRDMGGTGPVVAINAGWLDREGDDGELGEALDGRMRNLRLHARREEVFAADAELAEAFTAHSAVLAEQQTLYALRLRFAVDAASMVWRRGEGEQTRGESVADALAAIRALDDWHLRTAARRDAEFAELHGLASRPSLRGHRDEVAAELASAAALVIAGGHVGVLLSCLRMFGVPRPTVPVLAWSAGAMAVGERVVLYDDHGVGNPPEEVLGRGLGWYTGVLPLPHARRRLQLGDRLRIAGLARRFDPLIPLILDDGVRVELPAGGGCPPGNPVLGADGCVGTSGSPGGSSS